MSGFLPPACFFSPELEELSGNGFSKENHSARGTEFVYKIQKIFLML